MKWPLPKLFNFLRGKGSRKNGGEKAERTKQSSRIPPYKVKFECIACTEKVNRWNMCPLELSTSRCCTPCFIKYVAASESYPIVDIENRDRVVPDDVLAKHMPPDIMRRIEERCIQKALEDAIASSANPDGKTEMIWHCPQPDCRFRMIMDTEIPNANDHEVVRFFKRLLGVRSLPDERKAKCQSCSCASCRVCGKPWVAADGSSHDHRSCSNHLQGGNEANKAALTSYWNDVLARAWADQNDAKACPRCSRLIQKNKGCNSMRCKCGYQFCWDCLGENCGHGGCRNRPTSLSGVTGRAAARR